MKNDKATRHNSGKPKLTLIPVIAQIEEAKVWTVGEAKYGRANWEKGFDTVTILDSLFRHVAALLAGQDLDPETGIHHAAHIRCNAGMLIHMYHTETFTADSRSKISDELLGRLLKVQEGLSTAFDELNARSTKPVTLQVGWEYHDKNSEAEQFADYWKIVDCKKGIYFDNYGNQYGPNGVCVSTQDERWNLILSSGRPCAK